MIKRLILTVLITLLLSPASMCLASETAETLTVPEERSEETTLIASTEAETETEETETIIESLAEIVESSEASESVTETVIQVYDDTRVLERLDGILTHLQVIEFLLGVLLAYTVLSNIWRK